MKSKNKTAITLKNLSLVYYYCNILKIYSIF